MRTCDISIACNKAATWRRDRAHATAMSNTEAACTAHKLEAGEVEGRPWKELKEKPLEVSSKA